MSERRERREPEEWTPATSKPGEVFTPEGNIRLWGAFARGATNDDPRLKPYRRQMWRTGLSIVVLGLALIVAIAVVTALF